jgi:hypothetical protein
MERPHQNIDLQFLKGLGKVAALIAYCDWLIDVSV